MKDFYFPETNQARTKFQKSKIDAESGKGKSHPTRPDPSQWKYIRMMVHAMPFQTPPDLMPWKLPPTKLKRRQLSHK